MTAYVVEASWAAPGSGSSGTAFTVVPGPTFPVRIARFEVWANGQLTAAPSHVTSAHVTGGTAVTPMALRGGAPASTASVTTGATVSGTQHIMSILSAGSTQFTIIGTSHTNTYTPGTSNYTWPFDYILIPGEAFTVSLSAFNFLSIYATIYYEELRLQWSV